MVNFHLVRPTAERASRSNGRPLWPPRKPDPLRGTSLLEAIDRGDALLANVVEAIQPLAAVGASRLARGARLRKSRDQSLLGAIEPCSRAMLASVSGNFFECVRWHPRPDRDGAGAPTACDSARPELAAERLLETLTRNSLRSLWQRSMMRQRATHAPPVAARSRSRLPAPPDASRSSATAHTALCVDQRVRAIRVDLQLSVEDDLSCDPANLRGFGTRRRVIDQRERQRRRR